MGANAEFPPRALELLERAAAGLAEGRHAEAAARLSEAQSLAPEHPRLHFLLAELALARQEPATAIGHAVATLGRERRSPEPFALLGWLLHLAGDSPLAAKLLERALALAPANLAAQQALRATREQPRTSRTHPELAWLGRRPTVGLAMIVKDEAENLARCLRSVRRHVDEMVVVDTGSSDATVAIATTLGARVEHFTWSHDFAAARNHALACLTTDWVLVLDADEELEAAPGALHALVEGLPWPEITGVVPLVSLKLYNHAGSIVARGAWEAMTIARLFPRTALRYHGAVHETPELPAASPQRIRPYNAFQLEVHHHGYRPEVMHGRAKLARNIALLRQRLVERPDDVGGHYLLGRELIYDQAYQEGLASLERYEAGLSAGQRERMLRLAPCLQARALGMLGRDEEALERLERAIALDPDFPSYHYARAEKLVGLGRYDEAIASYDVAIARADYHEHHPLTNYNAIVPAHAGNAVLPRRARAIALRDGTSLPEDAACLPDESALGAALTALTEGRLDDAERELALAAQLAPTHPQVFYVRAELLLRRGDFTQALQAVFRSLQLDVATAEPWALAGYLLHQAEDSPLAAAFLECALQLSPEYAAAAQLLRQVRACPRTSFQHPELAAWLKARLAPRRS